MQSKSEIFNNLLEELKIETAQNLSNRELVNLSMTSKYHFNLFQPLIDVRKLLHHVTRGEHDAVKAMLKKDMSLIFKKGLVTDCSGREFENISPFEYALWALDKHMWATMIACIPQNQEGRKVFKQLIAQYNKVNTIGVTYKLNGATVTEQHFDFKNIIIETLVDLVNAQGVKNGNVIGIEWRVGVGGVQKLLPMHVVYEYCSDEPFFPVPDFTSQPKSSKQIYDWVTDSNENWFGVDSRLSVDFAVYKGSVAKARALLSPRLPGVRLDFDLNAMIALCKVRTKDFLDLNSQLKDQMTLDNHHQVSQICPN
ncbi:hypothetical protein [Legionella hackeliae]|uniref:Uncharacterized protein n=1 Tax=Legionella hackeliae TaxID=449 RepID=A0A0A8UT25_LEGHA|nr:hypothetical protein [Legionella hackeliae]KTD10436.1 hypothetical protein Lhac_2804 [Legionella hackeliae]CEK09934.1 conserved protein of unknown function [Legionella hackeliae]STX49851.1 SidC homolog [Legionella hackeliae]